MISEQLQTKIHDSYDVIVAGGGVAGISAALSCAREGKKVLLIERSFILGGLATSGIVTIYLPLCDGFGHQLSYGIAEELLRLSISLGAEDRYPENFLDGIGTKTEKDKRFEVQFNPQIFALLCEELLVKENVTILYGTNVVNVKTNDDKIEYIICENKSGRMAFGVDAVVDATGDSDVCELSGAPTKLFKAGNLLAAWYYNVSKDGYKLNMYGFCDIPDEEKKQRGEVEKIVDKRFGGLDAFELSKMMTLSHKSIIEKVRSFRKTDDSYWPVTIATIPQIRMTRRIVSPYEMKITDDKVHMKDSVGMICDWRKRGPVYEVPFSALYSSKIKNLISAGRCISSQEDMWDVTRVIPPCAVTGEAAGLACALTNDFKTLDVKILQEKLKNRGVKLHKEEVGL